MEVRGCDKRGRALGAIEEGRCVECVSGEEVTEKIGIALLICDQRCGVEACEGRTLQQLYQYNESMPHQLTATFLGASLAN